MIRNAMVGDLTVLYRLETSIFSKDDFGLSRSSFYYHIKKNSLFVCVEEGTIVAYILWLKRKNYFRLYSLCVHNTFQGKGLASQLLEYSFNCLEKKQFHLEVKISNTNAIKLYTKYGFTIKKILQNYYPNNIDGYLMIRE